MKPQPARPQAMTEPGHRQERAVIKPVGKYPSRNATVEAYFKPSDATGVNAEHMKPIHPDSVYIPPA